MFLLIVNGIINIKYLAVRRATYNLYSLEVGPNYEIRYANELDLLLERVRLSIYSPEALQTGEKGFLRSERGCTLAGDHFRSEQFSSEYELQESLFIASSYSWIFSRCLVSNAKQEHIIDQDYIRLLFMIAKLKHANFNNPKRK